MKSKLKAKMLVMGAGKLAQSILHGFFDAGVLKKNEVIASTRSSKSACKVQKDLGIRCFALEELPPIQCKMILVAVKPHQVDELMELLVARKLSPSTLILSLVAARGTKKFEKYLPKNPVVIAMTNTASAVGEAMTVLFKGKKASEAHLAASKKLFSTIGRVEQLPEKHFHAATALAGSSPAFVLEMARGMILAGKTLGLKQSDSRLLSAQAIRGAATMILESAESIEKMQERITTPNGVTEAGLRSLRDDLFRLDTEKAVATAEKRSRQLARKMK